MMNNHHAHSAPWWRSRTGLALLVFLVVAAFYLWSEHRAHLFGILPYLLALLACVLMLWLILAPSQRR